MIRHLLKLVWNRKGANALIVAEIFISFLVVFAVLTGAVTLLSGWTNPIGFDYGNVWDVRLDFEIAGSEKLAPEALDAVQRMLAETRTFPEVASSAVSSTPPYSFSHAEGTRNIQGRRVNVVVDEVSDDFDDVMNLEVLRGRWFDRTDDAAKLPPIILDANTALEVFGTIDAVGRLWDEGEQDQRRVVGVIKPYRKNGEASLPMNMIFLRTDAKRSGAIGNHILLRLHPGTAAEFEQKLVTRLQQVAPTMSFRVRHMDQMRTAFLRSRFSPVVLGGILGLFLIAMVTLGLTGVLWQSVTRRTRELGLRRAVGASGMGVRAQILIEVALLATIACIVGSVIVLQLPILGIFQVVTRAAFATGFAGALAAIYALTVLCGLYPSWLASRLEPAEALRYE